MPGYKNRFRIPEFIEGSIVVDGADNVVVGTIRVKPSSVLWKPKGAHVWYAVSLDKFREWITSEDAGARKVKK
jgi:hypothetical protein